jgi:hypothetical protein
MTNNQPSTGKEEWQVALFIGLYDKIFDSLTFADQKAFVLIALNTGMIGGVYQAVFG